MRHISDEDIHQPMTVEDYLRFEESSAVRHEFVEGQLYALAGASARHNDIVLNLTFTLTPHSRRQGCRLNAVELMLQVNDRRYYYPDVAVYCEGAELGGRFRNHPCLVVEVLSPTTKGIDRREKLFAYRGIDTLETYLIVSQDEFKVERHWRDADGAWQQQVIAGDGVIPIGCLDTQLQLSDIYAGLDPLPPAEDL